MFSQMRSWTILDHSIQLPKFELANLFDNDDLIQEFRHRFSAGKHNSEVAASVWCCFPVDGQLPQSEFYNGAKLCFGVKGK
jgi:hypothetical protein